MSVKERAVMAFGAMKALGIPEKTVRPVLKNLLKLYNKNWELIEDENYRVLADAIFDYQDNEAEEAKKKIEAPIHDEPDGPPFKRLRLRQQEGQASPLCETSFRTPKLEEAEQQQNFPIEEREDPSQLYHRDRRGEPEPISPQMRLREKQKEPALPQTCSRQESAGPSQLNLREKRAQPEPVSPPNHLWDKGKEPVLSPQTCQRHERDAPTQLCFKDTTADSGSVSSQAHLIDRGKELISPQTPSRNKRAVAKTSSSVVCFKKPKVEPDIILSPKEKLHSPHHKDALIKPKSEPLTGVIPQFEAPIAVIHPPNSVPSSDEDPVLKEGCSVANSSTGRADDLESLASKNVDAENELDGISNKGCKTGTRLEATNIPGMPPPDNFEIASSPLGEVKISLSCNYALERPDFHMPSLDAVLRMAEDKCLKSYKIIEPRFSLTRLMKELCQCFLDLGTDSTSTCDKQKSFIRITSNLDLLKNSNLQNALGAREKGNFDMPASFLNGSVNIHSSMEVVVPKIPRLLSPNCPDSLCCTVQPNWKVLGKTDGESKEQWKGPDASSLRSLVAVPQHKLSLHDVRPIHDVNDISKGEERVKISLINEVISEPYPPLFYYVPRNIVYQSAYVNFSLSRIDDVDCCSSCFGDCLSSSVPCACARESGGDFAYSLEGLITDKFLDECISMNRDPQQDQLFYCKDCPLESSKNESLPDPCKGHLVRKFIKECWSKCGCDKQCGNRVVQRGISCNLQVFFTSEGKGWGLRTLEDLPRGSFVCEYVGEILTTMELYERNIRRTAYEKNTYPVLLDADWGSVGVLKDEEALCLDATFYGNVARFINHRCFDANLVEIPVEIETPDHHYYHLAFFTTRDVEALEELTWDYGIDFDEHNHPFKFQCRCGSKCCRDMKCSYRTNRIR